jgi:DNA polymerase I-like protein with 3'-5' exonuclease and polymerase domains
MRDMLKMLEDSNALHIYRVRCDLGDVLAHIEAGPGMLLDGHRVIDEHDETAGNLAAVKAELDSLTGGINLRSRNQLAKYLYDDLGFPERTDRRGKPLRNKPTKAFPEGAPLTDQHTLKWLEGQAETIKQQAFIELRREYGKLNAALTKNLQFFYGVINEYDSWFNAQFNQTVAATHRLTSSGVPLEFDMYGGKKKSTQFQNMPRAYKRLFTAPDDWLVVEVDSSQLEFRVAAYLGQDEQAMSDIADPNFDAHCVSAAVMNGVDYDQFLEHYRRGDKHYKVLRTAAKVDTFKPLYGGERGTPAQEKWYKEFRQRYSGVYSQQEEWLSEVYQNGSVTLPWGMTFRWKTKLNKRGVLLDSTTNRPVKPQVFNYPVQSLATAEIVPISIISLYRRCKQRELRVRFVNTVHDSVIAYVHKDDVNRYVQQAQLAFTSDVYDYLYDHYGIQFNVPLGCEAVYGKHWGEGTEVVYDDVNNWKDEKYGT